MFAVGGALTGLAAVLNAVRFNQIPSNAGIGLELQVIAAVVVGGAAIAAAAARCWARCSASSLLGTIGPALVFLGVSAYWEQAIQGAIILVGGRGRRARRRRASCMPPSRHRRSP